MPNHHVRNKKTAPYGSWLSPITSELIVTGSIRLGQIVLDGDAVYWTEGRPSENGRNTLVKWTLDEGMEELSPAGFNVRTRVHEYGGGAYTVHDDVTYFINFVDQRLYTQYPYSEPEPLTSPENYRFADGVVDDRHGRMFAIREQHIKGQEAINTLVSINLDGYNETGDVLVSGNDFYATPRLNADGTKLAWLTWNHPNMPWDGTELWVADLHDDGTISNQTLVAGGKDESVFQPAWSPDGVLHFVSDRTNWWNLYRWVDGQVENLCPMDAEFGLPQWVFGMTTYGFESGHTIICAYTKNGKWQLARLNTNTKTLTNFDTPYASFGSLQVSEGVAVFVGGAANLPSSVVRLDLLTDEMQVLRQSANLMVGREFLSIPQSIEYPTENGLTAHGIYYPPLSQDFKGSDDEKPPLLVLSHGGPTGATSTTLSLSIQYWTSRGFAVLDVNYGGSTGYGRSYRQRLNGQWGVVDVQDCVNGAKYLVDKGQADGERLAIRGGSAGGYTTLCAITFYNVFGAGASHFGVSDIEALAKDTHKFESRYLDSMVGPYPEMRQLYLDRSPIHHVDQISTPLILFQGLEDKVVPPNQAEMMFNAVKEKGIPVAYVPFEGEQHGFRQAPNIKRALDGEFYFYSKVFGYEPAEAIKPVHIENL
ncbi:MAG: S9 family peptidase [Chloroflexi bacterium]|nr:MAG: S9 family peptidase [Chloroflexota bacterium]